MEQITITVSTCPETGLLIAAWNDSTCHGGLTTKAATLRNLEANIREAIAAHFDPGELPTLILLTEWDETTEFISAIERGLSDLDHGCVFPVRDALAAVGEKFAFSRSARPQSQLFRSSSR